MRYDSTCGGANLPFGVADRLNNAVMSDMFIPADLLELPEENSR